MGDPHPSFDPVPCPAAQCGPSRGTSSACLQLGSQHFSQGCKTTREGIWGEPLCTPFLMGAAHVSLHFWPTVVRGQADKPGYSSQCNSTN